jgi:hypothetical protein
MFGKPFFKIIGKVFICFFKNEMDFKLTDDINGEALKLTVYDCLTHQKNKSNERIGKSSIRI